jgi:hypothetical protein
MILFLHLKILKFPKFRYFITFNSASEAFLIALEIYS